MGRDTLSKRERDWKRRGIACTDEMYEALREQQENRCNICRDPEHYTGSLHVDHCHTSGRVRGLLCGKCNRAIGQLGDDVETLERALHHVIGYHLQRS